MYKFNRNRQFSLSDFNQLAYIHPIVRGRAGSLAGFGARLNMSINERGIARLEYLCFDALSAEERKQAYVDNTDRIGVERGFSLAIRISTLPYEQFSKNY